MKIFHKKHTKNKGREIYFLGLKIFKYQTKNKNSFNQFNKLQTTYQKLVDNLKIKASKNQKN